MLKYEFLGYDSSTNDERPGGTGAQGHPSRSRPQLPVINPILMMLDSDIFLVVNRLDMLWSDLYSQLDAYFDGTLSILCLSDDLYVVDILQYIIHKVMQIPTAQE